MTRQAFVITLILFATSWQVMAQKDKKARKILDQLSEKNKQYETITAEFSSRMVNEKDDVNMDQEGKLRIKGEMFMLDLGDQKVYSDGQNQWTFLEQDNEVHIDSARKEAENESELVRPSDLFTIWESGFKYQYKGEEVENGQTFHTIELFPTDPSEKAYHTIILTVNGDKMTISKLHVKGKYGTDYIYEVKDFQTDLAYQKSDFRFNEQDHPGVEVIDLR